MYISAMGMFGIGVAVGAVGMLGIIIVAAIVSNRKK